MKSPKAAALEVARIKERNRKTAILAKMFPSLADIMKDEKFNEFLSQEITKTAKERKNFSKPGFRLRRNAFDQLHEKGQANAKAIIEEYEKIRNGVSKEPFAIRSYIVQLVSVISRQVISHYSSNLKPELPFDVDWDEITSKSKKQTIVYLRMIIANRLRNSHTLAEIGTLLKRDHSTVSHYLLQYETEYKTNKSFKILADTI